jgi:hypothetical protein
MMQELQIGRTRYLNAPRTTQRCSNERGRAINLGVKLLMETFASGQPDPVAGAGATSAGRIP